MNKDKNGKNVPRLQNIEVLLVHCNIAKSGFQRDSNKSFGQLLEISSTNSIFLKTYNPEISYIEVWFTDQNSNPLEIEDGIK